MMWTNILVNDCDMSYCVWFCLYAVEDETLRSIITGCFSQHRTLPVLNESTFSRLDLQTKEGNYERPTQNFRCGKPDKMSPTRLLLTIVWRNILVKVVA